MNQSLVYLCRFRDCGHCSVLHDLPELSWTATARSQYSFSWAVDSILELSEIYNCHRSGGHRLTGSMAGVDFRQSYYGGKLLSKRLLCTRKSGMGASSCMLRFRKCKTIIDPVSNAQVDVWQM